VNLSCNNFYSNFNIWYYTYCTYVLASPRITQVEPDDEPLLEVVLSQPVAAVAAVLLVIGVVCVSAISIHIRILRLRISVGLIPLTIARVASISTSPLVEILLRLEAYMHQLQLIGGKESRVISERLSEVVCWKDCGPNKATHSALQSTYLAEVPRPPQQMI
jgi:hypothetical protein